MKVSIQIPVYTGVRFLKEALESVYRQTYGNFEIIVVDDGAKVDVPALLSAYPEVIYIWQEHRGVAAARNRALDASSGEIIAFLDADDVWAEDKLEKQVLYLKEHPECEIIFTGVENFTELSQEHMTGRQKQLQQTDIANCLVSCCVRKSVFETYGVYQEACEYGEDTEFLARLAAAGVNMEHCLQETLYFRRIHEENMSLEHERVAKSDYLKLLAGAFRRAKKKSEV